MKIFVVVLALLFYQFSLGSQLKSFTAEKKAIEKEIERYKTHEDLKKSELELLNLRKKLILKEIDIIREQSKIKLEYYLLNNKLDELEKAEELLYEKLESYRKLKKDMTDNRIKTTKLDEMKLNLLIASCENELAGSNREKVLVRLKIQENEFDKNNCIQGKKLLEATMEQYGMLLKISRKELKFLKLEGFSIQDIDIKFKEIEALECKRENILKEYTLEKKELETELLNREGSLHILNLRIENKKVEKEILKKELELGKISKSKLWNKNIEFLDLEHEKLEISGEIKSLELKLEV